MNKKIIKDHLAKRFLSEEVVLGLSVTNTALKKSKEINKQGVKDIEKKITDFEKNIRPDANAKEMAPSKFSYENKDEKTYHDQMEIMNGQEMIQYSSDPSERFKERALEAIEGSSNMGNNPEWSNVIPAQQGFTGPDFGKNLAKNIKASTKKRNDADKGLYSFGDDIENDVRPNLKNTRFSALSEAKVSEAEIEKGKFTSWCKRNGFEGPSISCAKKAMASDSTSAHKMATFYMNTVKPKGKTAADLEENKTKLKEAFGINKNYTHFAIDKQTNKIVNGWDYRDLYDKAEKKFDVESVKEYSKTDLIDTFPERKPSEFNIVTKKTLEKKGINPLDTNNWHKLNENPSSMEKNKDNKKTEIKESMKRLSFKNPFNGVGNALKLIPEGYKVNNKVFEMTDGNETYKIRWEGNLSEGKAVVLTAADKTLVNEDITRMKQLYGYKSHETLGLLKGKERIDENKIFSDIWGKTKTLLETEDMEGADANEGNWDDVEKNAPEATKHVKTSVKKDMSIAKGKEGNPDKAVKHAAEAKTPMKSSKGVNIETEAEFTEGTWEAAAKPQAPEAKKHVHLKESEMEEAYMDEAGMYETEMEEGSLVDEGYMDEEMIEEMLKSAEHIKEEEEEEEEEEVEDTWEKGEEEEEGEEEPTASDLKADIKMPSDEEDEDEDDLVIPPAKNFRLLFSQTSGEYWIDNNGVKSKVPDQYYSIASDKSKKGSEKAAKISAMMARDAEKELDMD